MPIGSTAMTPGPCRWRREVRPTPLQRRQDAREWSGTIGGAVACCYSAMASPEPPNSAGKSLTKAFSDMRHLLSLGFPGRNIYSGAPGFWRRDHEDDCESGARSADGNRNC